MADVRSEHSSAFLRLRQLWDRRSHFSLVLAMVDNPEYRDALIARLDAVQPGARIDLDPADPPAVWLQQGEARYAQGQQRLHVCLPLDTRHGDHWWQQANVVRERLADAMPTLQVVWLSQTDVETAAHHAPDLWNWREAVLDFTALVVQPERTTSLPDPTKAISFGTEAVALTERLTQIEDFLARQAQLPDPDARPSAHLLLEATRAHRQLGQWKQSTSAAQQAADLFAACGDAAHAAQARAEEAEILQFTGSLDKALAVLTQKVLPVYERLGDVRSKAVTMGKIADIFQARGQLDEALRIRREEALPVYERLGDVRSLLVGRANLAILLMQRGRPQDRPEASRLLSQAHRAARDMQLPEADQVARLHQTFFARPILNDRPSSTKSRGSHKSKR
jgi:tetratricopeptide (TPR) repeat protein